MERAPYVYQVIGVKAGERPHKSVLRQRSPEPGCEWNETVIMETTDQSEANDAFAAGVKNRAHHKLEVIYIRRLGYPARLQEWRRDRQTHDPAPGNGGTGG